MPLPLVEQPSAGAGARVLEPHPPCGARERRGIPAHPIDRALAFDAQPILETAEEGERARQEPVVVEREEAFAAQGVERVAGRALSHRRVVVAVGETENLCDELHVDEAAAPGLQVEVLRVLARELALHAPAEARDLGALLSRQAPAVDEVLDHPCDRRAERRRSRDRPRADESLPLPHRRRALVVAREPVERRHERAGVPRRPQAGVDLVDVAFARRDLQIREEELGDLGEELVRADPAV